MNVILSCIENTPVDSDRLNSSLANGANTCIRVVFYRRRIGSGSVWHTLCPEACDDIIDDEIVESREVTARRRSDAARRFSVGSRSYSTVALVLPAYLYRCVWRGITGR